MTPDHEDQRARLYLVSVLQRLQRAGWITRFEEPEEDQDFVIEWNPNAQPMGGKTNLYALTSMLREICPAKPLSEEEQAALMILRKIYFED